MKRTEGRASIAHPIADPLRTAPGDGGFVDHMERGGDQEQRGEPTGRWDGLPG